MTAASVPSPNLMEILSRLMFSEARKNTFSGLNREQFQETVSLAESNHVLMRSMDTLRGIMASAHDYDRSEERRVGKECQ